MPLGPVVARAALPEDKVVGTEHISERTGADGVHGAGLEIREHGARHVAASHALVEVDVHALQLQRVVAVVRAVSGDAVLRGHDL